MRRDLVRVRRGLVGMRRGVEGCGVTKLRCGLVGMRRGLTGVRCKIRKNKLIKSAGKRHYLKKYFFNEL
jgi:hypothetical protein